MCKDIIILNRRSIKQIASYKDQGYMIIDVTSKSDSQFIKCSPFYPHGNIEVPGLKDVYSESVEAIWQGLKVFTDCTEDYSKFNIKNMKHIKRSCNKYGRVLGHKFGEDIIDYNSARVNIYLPAYNWVIVNKLQDLMEELVTYNKLVLLDYTTNEDINNLRKPLSHASLIKAHLLSH